MSIGQRGKKAMIPFAFLAFDKVLEREGKHESPRLFHLSTTDLRIRRYNFDDYVPLLLFFSWA